MSSTLKRLLAMMFAFTLLAAACGSDSGGSDEGDTSDEDTTETTEATDGEEDTTETTEEAMDEDADTGDSGDAVDCASEDFLCVGLVTDLGRVDDKSFNQSAWEGVQASNADSFDYIETTDSKDYAANIASFVDQDYDVIVTVGFLLGESTIEAAQANPDITFIGVDQFQGEELPNLTGLIFNEDKAGFMAGALAGLLTESNILGAVLGTDAVPPVVAFKEGWENGAKYTNPDVTLLSTYHPNPETAFTDPVFGADTARQAIDNGADIIFAAGGQTGNGGLAEIAKDGGDVLCVGVDSDQWDTVPEAQPCLVTSAMKLITPGVTDLIAQAGDGSIAGGNFFGDVGLAPYHDLADRVSPEVQTQLDEIIAGVLDGSIPTGYGS